MSEYPEVLGSFYWSDSFVFKGIWGSFCHFFICLCRFETVNINMAPLYRSSRRAPSRTRSDGAIRS